MAKYWPSGNVLNAVSVAALVTGWALEPRQLMSNITAARYLIIQQVNHKYCFKPACIKKHPYF